MIRPQQDRCWRWSGSHRASDGRPQVNGRYVYRLIYEAATGEQTRSPLHHLCGNAWCVNPGHLEPLDQTEHLRRHGTALMGDWGQAAKTHCPAGHPYDDENTYVYRRANGSTERHCRICRRETGRRYRQRS